MANYGAVENCIEWLRGEHKATISLSDPDMIETVLAMAEKDKAVEVVDRDRHTLCARLPIEYVVISKPRKRKGKAADEGNPGGHTPEAKAPRSKGTVLRKRRLPRR